MVTPSVPGFTGWLIPSKSPLCGIAWPDFDSRATITTIATLESVLDGIMLFESSSRNVKGKSFFVARMIATGIGGPFVSRANTNNVSVADPLPARLGAILTLPLITSDCPIGLTDAAGSACADAATASTKPKASKPHLIKNLSDMCNAPLLEHNGLNVRVTAHIAHMYLSLDQKMSRKFGWTF